MTAGPPPKLTRVVLRSTAPFAATYASSSASSGARWGGSTATVGATSRAETVASDAFSYFEAGANGFHEAVEDASEERYHSFEEALGALRSATTGDADAADAAETFADEATAAVYAIVENGGSGGAGAGFFGGKAGLRDVDDIRAELDDQRFEAWHRHGKDPDIDIPHA